MTTELSQSERTSSSNETLEKSLVSRFAKRGFDLFFSLTIVAFFSPLYLLIAFCILLESKGGVFYFTERVGKDFKPIMLIKFRSMHSNADATLKELLENDPNLKKEWEIFRKLKKDPRCSFVGRILRKTSLDELPQFFNVIKGDLSVVGPRPYFFSELSFEKNAEEAFLAKKILSVKPGITGLWQTSGRSKLSFASRMKLEAFYVDKQSFWYDFYLVLKTIPSVLFFKGAF